MPTRTPGGARARRRRRRRPRRQHPAVGVAERDDLGAGVVRRPQHLERVVAVVAVAVEEVLGVEEHPLPLRAQVADGVADHREVLLERGAQRQLDVPVVGLGDQRDDRRRRCRAARRPAGRRRPGRPARRVAPKAASVACRRSSSSRGAAEELGVLGVRARPAALDVADAEPVELARDRQLVGDGEVEPLLLGAVAQRRVVDVEACVGRGWCSSRGLSVVGDGRATKRPPVGTRGQRAGVSWRAS